ncbi:MAG: hypothetical protein ACP5E9_10930 [Candidatus Methanospirareceae archaeon]
MNARSEGVKIAVILRPFNEGQPFTDNFELEELDDAEVLREQGIMIIFVNTRNPGGPAPLACYNALKQWAKPSLWTTVVAEVEEQHGIPDPFEQLEREQRAAVRGDIPVIVWPSERLDEGYQYLTLLVAALRRHKYVPTCLPDAELMEIVQIGQHLGVWEGAWASLHIPEHGRRH